MQAESCLIPLARYPLSHQAVPEQFDGFAVDHFHCLCGNCNVPFARTRYGHFQPPRWPDWLPRTNLPYGAFVLDKGPRTIWTCMVKCSIKPPRAPPIILSPLLTISSFEDIANTGRELVASSTDSSNGFH